MLNTIVQKNRYMDSIALMLLTRELNAIPGMKRAAVMMGTPANKEILLGSGYCAAGMDQAGPNDMLICFEGDRESGEAALDKVSLAMTGSSNAGEAPTMRVIDTWREVEELNGYNLCLISVPGIHAGGEVERALSTGRHAFVFSDNVPVEEERRLKELAHDKGLLVMGPDCGTGIIGGVPLAFANAVDSGNIGIIGASGTGIQQVCASIQLAGGGISHAIGVGGRDLSGEVGAISTMDAIAALAEDDCTEVLLLLSKPPAPEIAQAVLSRLKAAGKPAVVLFLGNTPRARDENLHFACTLEDSARMALELAGISCEDEPAINVGRAKTLPVVRGLFSGGTLAHEAAMLFAEALGLPHGRGENGLLLEAGGISILDLGDDVFTRGRPHPMIDATLRTERLEQLTDEPCPLVVLLDVVLGHGAAPDPAGDLGPAVRGLLQARADRGRETHIIANLVGTRWDPQRLHEQKAALESMGVTVYHSNSRMVAHALTLMGASLKLPDILPVPPVAVCQWSSPSPSVVDLLHAPPGVVNIGVQSFADDLDKQGARVVHFRWKPAAGGDVTLQKALTFLHNYRFPGGPYRTVDEANQAVLDKVRGAAPFLTDVIPARSAAPQLEGKVLLHAGPPILWENMTSPMQGSCVGAVLFEGWARSEDEAWAMLAHGEIEFIPCHHLGFVGPMGGITSGSMPVLKVVNRTGGNAAYCTINEGIGPVLRFGAYSHSVLERLRFMRDTLAPALSRALRSVDGGLNVNVMVGKAIGMGDEFHQRNIAASLVFFKEVAPIIAGMDIPNETKRAVTAFLADTDQFFLNIMMAAAKSVMDEAATIPCGTVVTAMSRNGEHFGIRIAGMGEQWFTAPVNVPDGLYFSGYSREDANSDMGDSAITETFGVGGMAMIAAPAVTRFVGSGGFYDALETSNRMKKICITQNGQFPVPTWDFQGICLGIDARLVAETGITPMINTGIAHKQAGKGQIGAGTVTPPLECFSAAVLAYANQLGFVV